MVNYYQLSLQTKNIRDGNVASPAKMLTLIYEGKMGLVTTSFTVLRAHSKKMLKLSWGVLVQVYYFLCILVYSYYQYISIFVFYNKLPQARCPQTEIYSLTLLETRSTTVFLGKNQCVGKTASSRDLRGESIPCLFQLLVDDDIPLLWPHYCNHCIHLCIAFSFSVFSSSVSNFLLLLSYKDTCDCI